MVVDETNLAVPGDEIDGLAVGIQTPSCCQFERCLALGAAIGVVETEGGEGHALSLL